MSTPSLQRPLQRRTCRFGPQEWEVYDAWTPDAPRAEVTVVLVHGGLWQTSFDRAHLRPLGLALARDGWSVASVEYTRVGMPRGGWPGTGTSVVAAIEAVATDPELPDRLVAVGHSAGGQLAVWAASDGRCPALTGVVSLAGVLDLRLADTDEVGSEAVRALLGGAPEQSPQAWADADPTLGRLDVPAVLLHGAADTLVPPSVSASYLRSRGPSDASCRLEILAACDHFGIIGPGHTAYGRVTAAINEVSTAAPAGAGSRA